MKPTDYLILDGFSGMVRSATLVLVCVLALVHPLTLVFVFGLISGVLGGYSSYNEYRTSLKLVRKDGGEE